MVRFGWLRRPLGTVNPKCSKKSYARQFIKGRKKERGPKQSRGCSQASAREKKGHSFGACPTGSDLEFSFEKEMDSYERILYGDVNVSSKRVCTGRVVVV